MKWFTDIFMDDTSTSHHRLNSSMTFSYSLFVDLFDDPAKRTLLNLLHRRMSPSESASHEYCFEDGSEHSWQKSHNGIALFPGLSCYSLVIFVCLIVSLLFLGISLCRTLQHIRKLPCNDTASVLLLLLEKEEKKKEKEQEHVQKNHPEYLVCLGDSLTHGTVSANYTTLLQDLLMHLPKDTTTSSKDWSNFQVVNSGINSELAYNVHQRLNSILALDPKIVILLIGSNDIKALAVPMHAASSKKRLHLPNLPSWEFFEENMNLILEKLHTHHRRLEIYLCSIPPLGEDLDDIPNQQYVSCGNILLQNVIAKFNAMYPQQPPIQYVPVFEQMSIILRSQQQQQPPFQRRRPIPFEKWNLGKTIWTSYLHYTFGISWNILGKVLYGNYLLVEGLHLNERGAEIVARTVLAALMKKNTKEPISDLSYSF